MINWLKRISFSLLMGAFGFASISAAIQSLQQGHVTVGRRVAYQFTQIDSPFAFYLSVAVMLGFGLAGAITAIIFLFARAARSEAAMTYLDSNVFHIGKGVKNLLYGFLATVGIFTLIVLIAKMGS
jgi:hypothetical protein